MDSSDLHKFVKSAPPWQRLHKALMSQWMVTWNTFIVMERDYKILLSTWGTNVLERAKYISE